MSFSTTRPACSASSSSRQWLARHFRDPYVREKYNSPVKFRARSAFKLLEIDEKFHVLRRNVRTIVDLGSAPGGWSQVVAGKLGWMEEPVVGALKKRGMSDGFSLKKTVSRKKRVWTEPSPTREEDFVDPLLDDTTDAEHVLSPKGWGTIIAVDLLPMAPIPGVLTLKMDFFSPDAESTIGSLLSSEENPAGNVDLLLSDMAANTTGNAVADSASSYEISLAVLRFAEKHLSVQNDGNRIGGGSLILKYFDDPLHKQHHDDVLRHCFHSTASYKPPSSRSESNERYWVCSGFKGKLAHPNP